MARTTPTPARNRRMRHLYAALEPFGLGWICIGHGATTDGDAPRSTWVRMVRMELVTPEGRGVDVLLTPDEARGWARTLIAQADRLDAMNADQGNGDDYAALPGPIERTHRGYLRPTTA